MAIEIPAEILHAMSSISPKSADSVAYTVYIFAGLKFAGKLDEASGCLQKLIATIENLPAQEKISLSELKKTEEFLSAVIAKFSEALR